MKILILDRILRFTELLISNMQADKTEIDVLTEDSGQKNTQSVHYITGSRRRIADLKKLRSHYHVIVDADALVTTDIEQIYQIVDTELYILFSTMQVYHFLKRKIFSEEDVTNDYIEKVQFGYCDMSPSEMYIKEKLLCEKKLIDIYKGKNTRYVILRNAKVYTLQDIYRDIGWILSRVKGQVLFILNMDDIVEYGYMNPVFIEDLCSIVSKIVLNPPEKSTIFNVAQDQYHSIYDYIEYVSGCLGKENQTEIYVLPPQNGDELEYYKTPVTTPLLLNNKKIKGQYPIEFTDTKVWINKIVDHLQKHPEFMEDIPKREREVLRHYITCIKKIYVQNSRMDETKKGEVIQLYENIKE